MGRDNFNLKNSHVPAALMDRFTCERKKNMYQYGVQGNLKRVPFC